MKSLTSFAYKILIAFMIAMLALTAMPVSPAFANVPAPIWFSAANGTTGPVTITPAQFTCATGNNRLLVVQVIAEYNNANIMTLTVTKGVALTQAVKTTATTRTGIWIGYLNDAQITANAGNSIVITEPAAGNAWTSVNVFVTCLTNVNQATPIVAGGTAFNSSDANTGSYTFTNIPAVDKGLMIYAAGHNGSNNFSAPTGYTESLDSAGSSLRVTTGFKAITATGNETGTINFNSNDRYAAAVVSINPAPPSTTALISSLNPSNSGDSVTFTATVTPSTATGTVTFMDGATPIGSGALDPSGVATFTTTLLAVGSHNITAAYGGDVNLDGSTSPLLVQNVNGPPAILSADNTAFTVLTAGTFTVLASGNPAPTFSTAGPLPAGVTLSAAGVLAGTPATGTVGTWPFTITATNGIAPDATQNFTLTVNKANQNITQFNQPANVPNSAAFGATFNINPTATSGLTVSVVASGGCTLAGNTVTMTSPTVNCVLTATQAGNGDYNAAPTLVRTVTAGKATTTVSVSPSPHDDTTPSQSFYSHPMTFTVTVTSAGGTPTGTVTFSGGTPNQNQTLALVGGVVQFTTSNLNVLYSGGTGAYLPHGGNPLVCLIAGVACPGLVFTYNGDANFNADSEDVSHIVYPAPTQVAVASNINPSAAGQTVTFTVTVTTVAPGTGIPPGTVTIWDGLTQIGGPITLVNGVGTFNTSALAFGSHNITARFTSSSVNYASNNTSNTLVQNVRRATTTTLASDNNPSIYGENVTFTANVTSATAGAITGTVTFKDGAATIGTDTTIVGGIATFTTNTLAVGTHPITAVYGGDGTFATSTSANLDQVVNKATLNVTANPQSIIYGGADPTFTFTYSGFVLGETAAVIDIDPTCDAPTPHVNAGTYAGIIVCSGGLDNNYDFNYIDGTLTVTQKPLTITADNQGKTFGNTFTFTGTEFNSTGLINADSVISVTLTSTGAPAGAAAGTYPIVPSAAVGTGLGNYAITYVNGTMTVGANILTITANDQTKTYGDVFTFTGTEFTVTGLQVGDSIASVTLTSAGAASAAVVGTYPIVPSAAVGGPGTNLANYTVVYSNGTMDVNLRNLTFEPNDQTKVYGSVFSAYTGTFTGLRAGDNITALYDSPGAVATAPVGVYPITVTLDDPGNKLGNYNMTVDAPPTATLTVTPKALTITANNQSKAYGTDFIFAGTEFGVTGLTNGDTATSVTLNSVGAPAAALAGTYPIVPSAAVGTGLANYAITYTNGTMTVTKPDLIVTSDGQTKIYGDVFNAFTGSIVGLQNGDNITATYSSLGSPAAAVFGTYPIPIVLVDPGGKLVNYNVIQNVGTLSVVKRDLTVVADDKTKVYGDPVTLTGTVTGVQAGDNITFTYSSAGTPLTAPVGTYSIAITLNDPGNKIGNYNFTLTPATLTVTQRDLVVTPDDKSKQYGTFFLAFTGTITGIQNGDNITANYASAGSFPAAAVGPYPITTTLNDPTGKLGNYNVTINVGTLTVGSSALTVTAENKTKLYGDPDPAFTFTYFGFAAGDTAAVIDTQPTCTVAGAHTAVGTYPIVCAGGVDNAYTFTYIAGTLTVTQRPLVVTPTDKTKNYGDVFTLFTGNLTGVQAGDNITATYASTGAPATATVAGSPYPITATLNDPGNVLSNYTVTLNTGQLSVIQRALTVTPADKTKVYGDVFTLFTGTITGIQNGDAITATYASTGAVATATVAGSPYPITAILNAPAGVLANYTITVNTGNLAVTQRTLIVTPDNKAKLFGTVFNAFTGVIAGLQAGDNITVTYASAGSPAAAAVGPYPITATLNDPGGRLGNYTVTLNTGTLNVALSVLNVTAENKIIVYGDPDPAFTFTYTGFVPPDTAAVVDTQPTCQVSVAHNNVGTFPITCAGGVDNNYAFSYTPGTLTVTARPLTVTPDNKTKVYGDLFTTFSGTLAGIQGGDNITATYASTGAPAAAAVGNYPITATLNDPGNRLANYTVTLNTGTLAVTQRPLAVTPNPASKIYGSVFNAFTGTIVGIQNGDAITATYTSTGSPAPAAVGTYPITATLNAPAGILANYNVTNNASTLTVTQRDLIIQPADKTKVFGTVFTAFTGSIVGIQNGDAVTAIYASTGAPAAAAVGTYPITAVANGTAAVLANYNVTIGGATLTVSNSVQTITITTPAPNNAANGSSFTVAATASSGLPVVYSATGSCTNAGATFTINLPTGNCIVHYNQPGNANFGAAPELTENVAALANGQTITVTTSAPAFASPRGSFNVAATASSGLPVSITVSGVCTAASTGPGTATITIVSTNGTCDVRYNQAGDANFASAPQVIESTVIDNNSPTVTVNQEAVQVDPTNATPINFTVVFSEAVTGFTNADVTLGGTAGATTVVVTGAGGTYNVAVSGMTTDGTVTVSIPAAAAQDTAGNGNLVSTSTDNSVTFFDGVGPNVQVLNTTPATTDQVLSNAEVVTFNITQLKVKFNQDVYNPAGDSDADDVTNPNNYILIRDLGDTPGVQTISCVAGAIIPADTSIAIGTVTYDNQTHIATFTLNGGLPLSNGDYHLFVCGTTSIVDPLDNALALVGSAGLPSTDFRGSFTVNVTGGGGGGGGGGGNTTASSASTTALIIPVTGFNPNQVTILPKQPADKAYRSLDDIRIEIPSLGISFPIVGVPETDNGWNLTWLKDSVGYLESSAYPTFNGNTVLTAHVRDANKNLGPFSDIKGMQFGDRILIHAYGKIYVYEVQENKKISPNAISAAFKHEEYAWITLVTCEDYNAKIEEYHNRRMVRAVLISVVSEP